MLRCGMGETVLGHRVGAGTPGQAMRLETVGEGIGSGMVKGRDRNKIIFSGTVVSAKMSQGHE